MYLLKVLMHIMMLLVSFLRPEFWKTPMTSAAFIMMIVELAGWFFDLLWEEFGCVFAEEVEELGEDGSEMEG